MHSACSTVQVAGPHGDLVFRGPRVRMGLHWAPEGTVTNRWARLHQVPAQNHLATHRVCSTVQLKWYSAGLPLSELSMCG